VAKVHSQNGWGHGWIGPLDLPSDQLQATERRLKRGPQKESCTTQFGIR